MSATRLHKLTTIYLAVLYGLVGLTGESLHYLAADPTLFFTISPPAKTVVYYHTHGPDYHGHFHRHTHDGHHKHGSTDARHNARDSERSTAIAPPQLVHEPHACPLLTIVSALKLGHGGCNPAPILLDALVTQTFDSWDFLAFEVALYSYARGPPSGSCA